MGRGKRCLKKTKTALSSNQKPTKSFALTGELTAKKAVVEREDHHQ